MAPIRDPQAASPEERRSHRRYPVRLSLRYRLSRNGTILLEGDGTTHDFSAGGVFVCTDRVLPEGFEIELWMDWPVKMNGGPFLCVNLAGRVVRGSQAGSAVRIEQSEFRRMESVAAG